MLVEHGYEEMVLSAASPLAVGDARSFKQDIEQLTEHARAAEATAAARRR